MKKYKLKNHYNNRIVVIKKTQLGDSFTCNSFNGFSHKRTTKVRSFMSGHCNEILDVDCILFGLIYAVEPKTFKKVWYK